MSKNTEKTYRIHYHGKGKRKVINDWENFTAKNKTEAEVKAQEMAKKVQETFEVPHLKIDVHELSFVTFFELEAPK